MNLQLFGGRGGSSGMGGGSVTPTSMPNSSMQTIQQFANQFGTGMSSSDMATKVYRALPSGTDAHIVNDRYLQVGNDRYQFIKQRSTGSWKVKNI